MAITDWWRNLKSENSSIMAVTDWWRNRNQKIHPLWQLLTGGEIRKSVDDSTRLDNNYKKKK